MKAYTFPVCQMLLPASAAAGSLGSSDRDHSAPPQASTNEPKHLTERELIIYNRGFLDGRADALSEFLMLLEEGLPAKEVPKEQPIQ